MGTARLAEAKAEPGQESAVNETNMNTAVGIIERRVNGLGVSEAEVQTQGRENIIVNGNEVHLPVNKPVRVLLRSHDVLHDFFVPQFRARMNIVPGQMSWFWFTPTQAGRYEAMCAQLCGVGTRT